MQNGLHYADYLDLEKILGAQFPESAKRGETAHDEMLFIIIHQTYELWFKQLLYEVESILEILKKPALNDNSPELQTVVHRLGRCNTILKVLIHQIDVMETMTPMDFLDFRDMLRPASGFQSWQFKLLEARLGLVYEKRVGQEYYISQLRPAQIELVKQAEREPTVAQLLNSWLERMPFFNEENNWKNFSASPDELQPGTIHPFWNEYRKRFIQSLSDPEKNILPVFDRVFLGEDQESGTLFSSAANRAALFILLYRGYPVLQLPFQLLNQLLETDEQLSTWRYRHMHMVHRTIGTRIGTGGSSGKDYLKSATDQHQIFNDLAKLNSFLIERKQLPALSREMEKRLGFSI